MLQSERPITDLKYIPSSTLPTTLSSSPRSAMYLAGVFISILPPQHVLAKRSTFHTPKEMSDGVGSQRMRDVKVGG